MVPGDADDRELEHGPKLSRRGGHRTVPFLELEIGSVELEESRRNRIGVVGECLEQASKRQALDFAGPGWAGSDAFFSVFTVGTGDQSIFRFR